MMRILVVLGLFVCDCTSAAKDFENICYLEERSGAAAINNPADRAKHMYEWLKRNISSTKAREWIENLGIDDPATRTKRFKQAAEEAGYHGPCPALDGGKLK